MGSNVGRRYVLRINELMALPEFGDMRQIARYRFHALTGNRKGQFALDLNRDWRLIVKAGESTEEVVVWEVTNHYGD